MNPHRRNLLRYGCAATLAGSLPWRISVAGGSETAAAFDAVDLDWADAARQRKVPVRLYMPQVRRRTPLVVFSHGIGGSRLGYSWLGRHFARHGVASLHMQHVGSDNQLWHGNVFGMVGRLRDAAQEGEAIARARDVRFVLDTLLTSELGQRIDEDRIVAAGHSYGANTTLLASGAQVRRDGQLVKLRDDRVRAAIVMSAPPFYGEAEPRKILETVTVPSLHITCTADIIRIPGYYSAAEDRIAVFDATGSTRKWLTVYRGGSHSMFTDRSAPGGAELNAQVKAATQALSLAFVGAVFDDNGRELSDWPAQHAAILARFTVGGA